MSRIAARADVSKGTLYNYFPSKEALFAAFVREGCGRLIREVFDDPPAEVLLEAELERIGGTMLRMMVSPWGLAMFRVAVTETVKFPELARAFIAAGPAVMVARMADWLAGQVAAGRLAMDDPMFAAEQFFALTQARLVLRARTSSDFVAKESEIAHVVSGAVKVFMAAYGAAP